MVGIGLIVIGVIMIGAVSLTHKTVDEVGLIDIIAVGVVLVLFTFGAAALLVGE